MTEMPGKRSVKSSEVTYGPFENAEPLDDGGRLFVHYVSAGAGSGHRRVCRETGGGVDCDG